MIVHSTNCQDAVNGLIEFIDKENSDECLDIAEKCQLTDIEAIKITKECCKVEHRIDNQL